MLCFGYVCVSQTHTRIGTENFKIYFPKNRFPHPFFPIPRDEGASPLGLRRVPGGVIIGWGVTISLFDLVVLQGEFF